MCVCERLLQVLAIFCNPSSWPNGVAISKLALLRELQALQTAIPPRLQVVLPAARFPEDVSPALRDHQPRIVHFSGHGNAAKVSMLLYSLRLVATLCLTHVCSLNRMAPW